MQTNFISRYFLGQKRLAVIMQLMLLFSFALMMLTMMSEDVGSLTVSGDVSGQHWTVGDSPVFVTDDITISTSLHIDPAVKVRFAQGAKMIVNGYLWANGTKANPIEFTPNTGNPTPGYWEGVLFNGSQEGALKNVTITHAVNGIRSGIGGAGPSQWVQIENVTVTDASEHGMLFWSSNFYTIQDCSVDNCKIGIELGYTGWMNIYRSSFTNNSFYGVVINDSADDTYFNDTVFAFNNVGVYCWGWAYVYFENSWFTNYIADIITSGDTGANFNNNFYSRYTAIDSD